MLETVVVVFHLLAALGVIALVLLQQGRGADAGASFGSGASATVFGSQGSSTFLSRVTAILATLFFLTSLGLGFVAKQKTEALDEVGLPSPAALGVQQSKPAVEDVPVLQGQKPVDSNADVPGAKEQK